MNNKYLWLSLTVPALTFLLAYGWFYLLGFTMLPWFALKPWWIFFVVVVLTGPGYAAFVVNMNYPFVTNFKTAFLSSCTTFTFTLIVSFQLYPTYSERFGSLTGLFACFLLIIVCPFFVAFMGWLGTRAGIKKISPRREQSPLVNDGKSLASTNDDSVKQTRRGNFVIWLLPLLFGISLVAWLFICYSLFSDYPSTLYHVDVSNVIPFCTGVSFLPGLIAGLLIAFATKVKRLKILLIVPGVFIWLVTFCMISLVILNFSMQ